MRYSADFETNNSNPTRVWAWAICEIGNEDNIEIGNDIDSFMSRLFSLGGSTFYFHNLEFDGEFILSWLFNHGFIHSKEKKLNNNEFSTLISDMGKFYSIKIKNGRNYIKIFDSLKLIPLKVSQIPAAYGLEEFKGKIDYSLIREKGHILTFEEQEYIKGDVVIVAKALNILFGQGFTKMTAGANALQDFKTHCDYWRHFFDVYVDDKDLRQAYKGGWTYLKEEYIDKDIGEGIVLDVNSLYPYVMRNKMLPYGEGIYYKGKYDSDAVYPLFIQHIVVDFDLKEGYLPTIQAKQSLFFKSNKYLKSSEGNEIGLALTSVDLKLFLEHYNVNHIEYIDGWKFRGSSDLFTEYVDKWNDIKVKSGKEGNKGMRTIAKLMLNSLYGKFATNPECKSKIPYIDEEGVIKYKYGEKEKRKGVYLPCGIFITAWARDKTIRSAQKLYDRFIYADTDSLHLMGSELPHELDIDGFRLGCWKHESSFKRARFLKQKCYIEDIEGELKVTVAGLPDMLHEQVTWANFHLGQEYQGKLYKKHVSGGIILEPGAHKIR